MKEYHIVEVSCMNMRRWGRQALKGNWGIALLATILFSALISIPLLSFRFFLQSNIFEDISNLYTFLVTGPLNLGYITFIVSLFRRKPSSPAEVFYGFEHFFKALGLMLLMNILVMLWSLLFIIPGIIAALRYGMAFFVLADNPKMGVFQVLAESKRLMWGNKMKYFLLQISFMGWFILALLTAGVGLIWLMPYLVASQTGFYEVANGNLKAFQGELPSDDLENTHI